MIDPIAVIRNNWRTLLLATFVLASGYFLLVDGAPISGPAADGGPDSNASVGLTNLQYDIDLAGGARVSAPIDGYHVDADVQSNDEESVQQSVAAAMDIDAESVVTYTGQQSGSVASGTVEVRAVNDSIENPKAAFARGLADAGFNVSESNINSGVTAPTREGVVKTINQRLDASDISGGEATLSRTGGGETRVVIVAPGQDIEDIKALVRERGLVQQFAHAPADNDQGYVERELLRQDDIEQISTVSTQQGQPGVPVTLQQTSAEQYVAAMQETGVGNNPRGCRLRGNVEEQEPPYGYCVITKIDGETIRVVSIAPGLSQSINSGDFERNPSFRMTTSSLEEAQDLRLRMISGALPATLDFDRANEYQFSPELAAGFRQNTLITGLIAILTVVGVVFLRYGDPRVAVPMAATALSELVILLGIVAALGIPLDLAGVAGMIAVVGTGVDDLIIIADEVTSQGDVDSHRVFDSRVRKAFWVIGAAAATTIIAMSPLAILELGNLRLFAIITILGVIIGVAVSRPAYGTILRSLTTEY
jgi:preprotein translocase subunit SecD